MSQNDDFISQEAAMNALSPNEVRRPNMPVAVASQEAENQFFIANKYKVELAAVGLSEDTISLLLTRSNALRVAEAQWRTAYNSGGEDVRNWKKQSLIGHALKKDLSKSFNFAYRKSPRLLVKKREIGSGNGNDNMIQDLLEYATLGKANTAQLEAIKFDLTKLDTAIVLSDSLSNILSRSVGDKKMQHLLKDVRDRSFTIMKETLDYVRDAGKYAFKDQPDIRRLFTSDYLRKHNRKSKKINVTVISD